MRNIQNRSGQGSLEYMILVAGIVIVLVAFIGPKGKFSERLSDSLDDSTSTMTTVSERLKSTFE